MATPEKALLEVFYLGFKSLPEVELPRSFNTKKALDMIKKIPHRLAVPSWRGHSNVISLLRNALLPVEKLCLFIYNDLR